MTPPIPGVAPWQGGAAAPADVRVTSFTGAYSVQVQVLALRVLWTLQCEAALAAAARERHALSALSAHVGRHLTELVDLLALVKAAGQRGGPRARDALKRKVVSLESLITLQLSHVDATQVRWLHAVCPGV